MATSRRERKKIKKKRRNIWKTLGLIFLLLLLTVGVYAGYLYFKAGEIASESYEDDGRDKSELRETEVDPTEDNISILILGVDESEKRADLGSYRSDTIILATLNKKDHSVKMLSIPRDSYVYIPEIDRSSKINSAYAYGGTKASIETVENLLDIPVDYYVKLNFEAFIEVVDALGGVTVDVPVEFYEQNSKDEANAIHLLPGEQLLDGEEALALARTRKIDNDIERGKRQQEIIKAIVKKAASLGSVFKYDDVLVAVGDNMRTNMTFDEMKSLISYGMNGSINFETLTLAGYDDWSQGPYYYQLDEAALEQTKQTLKTHLELQ